MTILQVKQIRYKTGYIACHSYEDQNQAKRIYVIESRLVVLWAEANYDMVWGDFLSFLYPNDDDPGMFTFKMHQGVHLRHVHLHEKMLSIANS